MKRKTYDPSVRARIIQAAKSARAAGKTWKQALEAAKKAGYTGTADGLYQMVRKIKPTASKKAGKPTVKPKHPLKEMYVGGPPKPPAGFVNKLPPMTGRLAKPIGTHAMIMQLREQRAKLDAAIVALEALG